MKNRFGEDGFEGLVERMRLMQENIEKSTKEFTEDDIENYVHSIVFRKRKLTLVKAIIYASMIFGLIALPYFYYIITNDSTDSTPTQTIMHKVSPLTDSDKDDSEEMKKL